MKETVKFCDFTIVEGRRKGELTKFSAGWSAISLKPSPVINILIRAKGFDGNPRTVIKHFWFFYVTLWECTPERANKLSYVPWPI